MINLYLSRWRKSAEAQWDALTGRVGQWSTFVRRRQKRRADAVGVVQEYQDVLPILTGQLNETATQVEQSVMAVIGSFGSIVERAQGAVSSARDATHANSDEVSVHTLIEGSRRTLQQLLDHSVKNAHLSMQAVYRMEDVVKAMSQISTTTSEVDRIAFGIKILALNAKIESVHVGERGAGFAVVADEISRHAEQATTVAEGIRATVAELETGLHDALDNLQQLAAADMTGLIVDKDQAERTIELLDAGNAAMQRELTAAAANAELLANDVNKAVMAMQFQDRVNQRLMHVVEALAEMQTAFAATLTAEGRPVATGPAAAERLRERYTMAEERHIGLAPTGTEGASFDSGVDLF